MIHYVSAKVDLFNDLFTMEDSDFNHFTFFTFYSIIPEYFNGIKVFLDRGEVCCIVAWTLIKTLDPISF